MSVNDSSDDFPLVRSIRTATGVDHTRTATGSTLIENKTTATQTTTDDASIASTTGEYFIPTAAGDGSSMSTGQIHDSHNIITQTQEGFQAANAHAKPPWQQN